MDEREVDEPYCVLDIPHRFWTWVREYIGHIDEKFLRDFDQNFYQRYQSEEMDEYFINEPFKYKPSKHQKEPESSKHPKHLNGVHKSDSNHHGGRKTSKSQLNGVHDESSLPSSPPAKRRPSVQATREQLLKSLKSEENAGELMKKLVAAYVEDQANAANEKKRGRKPFTKTRLSPKPASTSTKRQKSKANGKKPKKMNGELNGKLNGHINGVESTDDETHHDLLQNSDLMESIGQALADCVMPVGMAMNGVDHSDSESEESETGNHFYSVYFS